MSTTNWVVPVLLAALASGQPATAPAQVDRVIRALAGGTRPLDGVRIETQCQDAGRFVTAAVHGGGAAIWNDERQGTVTAKQVQSLLELFARGNFARMPSSFGENEEGGAARPAVKMTCLVRFGDSGTEKTVMQLEKGRQSAALKRLARAILDAARAATVDGVSAASLDEGLAAVADGRLAVEALRITMRVGAAAGAGARGWVLRIEGRDLAIDPDVGSHTRRRLDGAAVREIARALRANGFATLPVNVHADGYVELTAAVLAHEHAVQARRFAGRALDPAIETRFRQAVAPLVALR